MGRTIIDIFVSLLILVCVTIGYMREEVTLGEFYLCLMINYAGARYLLMSDLDLALTKLELESMTEDENE